jgi:formylglycine-generating enzyme required for sulfatase activity
MAETRQVQQGNSAGDFPAMIRVIRICRNCGAKILSDAGPRRRTATLPVGSFKPNSIGLFDLGGSVWEWCLDTYKGDNSATRRDWGGCCAAAHGPQVIASKCNPLTETLLIATSEM